MIFTSVARLGDFLLITPIASWYYKTKGEKIHWVLSKNFNLYYSVEPLLRLQPFTENVSFVDVGTNAFKPEHWQFDPSKFGIQGEYRNFGFWIYPPVGKYMSDFYAEKYNFGVDKEFCLNIDESTYAVDNAGEYDVYSEASIYRPDFGMIDKYVPENCIKLDIKRPLVENLVIAKHARDVYCPMNGFAILMDLCNKKCRIYALQEDLDTKRRCYRNEHDYNLICYENTGVYSTLWHR